MTSSKKFHFRAGKGIKRSLKDGVILFVISPFSAIHYPLYHSIATASFCLKLFWELLFWLFQRILYPPPLNSRFLKSQFTGFLLIRGDLFGMFLFIRDSFSLVVLDFCGFLKFGLFQTFWIFQDPFRITELARITLDGRIILWLCLDLYGFLQSPSRFIEILSNLRWVLSVEFWRRWHKLLLTKNIRCC